MKPERLKAAQPAEACQEAAIAQASETMLKAYDYTPAIPDAAAKCRRDMALV